MTDEAVEAAPRSPDDPAYAMPDLDTWVGDAHLVVLAPTYHTGRVWLDARRRDSPELRQRRVDVAVGEGQVHRLRGYRPGAMRVVVVSWGVRDGHPGRAPDPRLLDEVARAMRHGSLTENDVRGVVLP